MYLNQSLFEYALTGEPIRIIQTNKGKGNQELQAWMIGHEWRRSWWNHAGFVFNFSFLFLVWIYTWSIVNFLDYLEHIPNIRGFFFFFEMFIIHHSKSVSRHQLSVANFWDTIILKPIELFLTSWKWWTTCLKVYYPLVIY